MLPSARPREALLRPRGRRGVGHIVEALPAYSLFPFATVSVVYCQLTNVNVNACKFATCFKYNIKY